MRITGGRARGIRLLVPKNSHIRPAMDALREAVFSALALDWAGLTFLDLFAGTGSYGLEALSRGAAGGVFVEQNPHHAAAIRKNLCAVGKSAAVDVTGFSILTKDAFLAELPPADVIFADPPYDLLGANWAKCWALLERAATASNQRICHIVFEMPAEFSAKIPKSFHVKKLLGGSRGSHSPTALILTPAIN